MRAILSLLLALGWLSATFTSAQAHGLNDLLVVQEGGQLKLSEPLALLNPYHLVLQPNQPARGRYQGLYALTQFNSAEFFSFRVLSNDPAAGGVPNGLSDYAFIEARIVSVAGPAGGQFTFWDNNAYSKASGGTTLFAANASTGNFAFNLSDPEEWPYPDAHYDNRGWSATAVGNGFYTVGIQLFDVSHVAGDPVEYAPSQIYYLNFQVVPEPGVLLSLALGGVWLAARRWRRPLAVMGLVAGALALTTGGAQAEYTHFEARQVHPLALTPQGTHLVAVNSLRAELAVFSVAGAAAENPALVATIPVGLEPVSVRARTEDEVWVVCEVSDAVYVVSLSQRAVIAALPVPDEPADVVFAAGKAFVSCARSREVRVFEAATRAPLGTIPVECVYPRALCASADGTRVYVASLYSGNNTTVLPAAQTRPQPVPTRAGVPQAPRVARIVPTNHLQVSWRVRDRDVAELDTGGLSVVRYLERAGAILTDVALDPADGALWVANTQARNAVRFEPVLKNHAIDSRLTRFDLATGEPLIADLNFRLGYVAPFTEAQRARALSQPTALAFSASGAERWVAAFGSDRVARVNAQGEVLARVDLRAAGEGTAQMRGPRGLQLNGDGSHLYVLNKLAGSVSVVRTGAAPAVVGEVPLPGTSPLSATLQLGRNTLFDARLSGNGTFACAACHLDADVDGLAWDLGDPYGSMTTVLGANLSVHDPTPRERAMHPLKGPMVTQTLRGIGQHAPFHWRGDRPTIQAFNATFHDLMGGTPRPESEIDALAAYLGTLRNHPNPNRSRDNLLPTSFNGGNAVRGRQIFNNHQLSHCNVCHSGELGTDNNVDLSSEIGSSQGIKTPPLGLVYQRVDFRAIPDKIYTRGFGLLHDGTGGALPIVHPYVLAALTQAQQATDLAAYVLAFDTGTAPAVGASYLATAENAATSLTGTELAFLETQQASGWAELLVRGRVQGVDRHYRFDTAAQTYQPQPAGAPLTRAALLALLQPGETLLFLGLPPGSATALAP